MNDSEQFFERVYLRRVNRFGGDYSERIQNKREKEFEQTLVLSPSRIDFWFSNNLIPGILIRKNQDNVETIQSLLTRRDLEIPNGTILEIANKGVNPIKWMVYYKEQI